MKIFLVILLAFLAREVYNYHDGNWATNMDPFCVTCGHPPYTWVPINCQCPPNLVKLVLPWICHGNGNHFHWGNCCDFPNVTCVPDIVCAQNQHKVFTSAPTCECECNNLNIIKCENLTQYNDQNCLCECPPWAYMICAKNQYFDRETCSCPCKEPCQDCARPQIWKNETCKCECPSKDSCIDNRYWNEWTCKCECKQSPRSCCPHMNKKWDPSTCSCICDNLYHCHPGQVWNMYTCQCEWITKFMPIDVEDTEAFAVEDKKKQAKEPEA